MKKFFKNQHGQSLIELSVAIGIISIALLAVISLVLMSLVTQRRSGNYYIAINLAREAVEVARNIRDTNWLIIEQEEYLDSIGAGEFDPNPNWDDNLYKSAIYSSTLRFMPEKQQDRFFFDFDNYSEQDQEIYQRDFSAPSPHTIYLDYVSCINYDDCKKTNFKRLIQLKPICDGKLVASLPDCNKDPSIGHLICEDGGYCDVSAPKIGIRVTVSVSWQEGGNPHNLELIDDIYNWR